MEARKCAQSKRGHHRIDGVMRQGNAFARKGQKVNVDLRAAQAWIDMGAPSELDVHLGGRLVHGLPTQAGIVVLTRRGLKA